MIEIVLMIEETKFTRNGEKNYHVYNCTISSHWKYRDMLNRQKDSADYMFSFDGRTRIFVIDYNGNLTSKVARTLAYKFITRNIDYTYRLD